MLEKISNYNKDMLVWAREESHIPDEEIEKHFLNYRQWEQGILLPNYSELKKLASFYKKPLAIFFFPEKPGLNSLKSSCRTIPSDVYNALSPETVRMMNYARAMQLNLYELFEGHNPNPVFKMLNRNIEHDELREMLSFTFQKQYAMKDSIQMLKYLRDKIADLGIHVFKNAFGDETVSGLCLYDEEFPVILINNTTAASRQCFTLMHELYHLLSATSGIDFRNDDRVFEHYVNESTYQDELECNRFSAQFFVPDNELIKHCPFVIDENGIEFLSNKFNVSREVIVRRLFEIKKITFAKLQEYIEMYVGDWYSKSSRQGNGGQYYSTQSAYFGDAYLLTVFHKYYSNKIDALQVSQYLNMSINNASKLALYKGWGEIK